MTDLRKAAEMALEALEGIHPGNMTPMAEESWNKAAEALRQALAQTEQEPVAYAGVTIWMGNKRITRLVTEPEIKYEREDGFSITAAAQYCLDELAKAKEQA